VKAPPFFVSAVAGDGPKQVVEYPRYGRRSSDNEEAAQAPDGG
jgi:hypothetical protein